MSTANLGERLGRADCKRRAVPKKSTGHDAKGTTRRKVLGGFVHVEKIAFQM